MDNREKDDQHDRGDAKAANGVDRAAVGGPQHADNEGGGDQEPRPPGHAQHRIGVVAEPELHAEEPPGDADVCGE